jgi:carbon-monoxide dehydrogenase medium subunit
VKPPRFEYADPAALDDALRLLAERGSDAKVLAGGQSLMPMLNMRLARPELLVDINRVPELDYLERRNGELAIGALARHHTVAVAPEAADACPLLALALPFVGHPAIRHRGTVCGSLAHADPAAELPAVATALGATMVTRSTRGERTIGVDEFFRSWFTTALEPDELLAEVRLPVQPPTQGSAFLEVARRHGDFAQVGIAVTLGIDREAVRGVRLVAFAVGPAPVRLRAAEAALEGSAPADEVLEAATAAARDEVSPTSDIHSSADYRRTVLGVLLKRAVRAAADDARAREGAP